MVEFLVCQVRMHKMTLDDVKAKYPKYYDEVKRRIEDNG